MFSQILNRFHIHNLSTYLIFLPKTTPRKIATMEKSYSNPEFVFVVSFSSKTHGSKISALILKRSRIWICVYIETEYFVKT